MAPLPSRVVLLINLAWPQAAILLFWSYCQATPGKMLLSLKIAAARSGGAPTKAQYAGRYCACILSPLVLGLGFLWIAFDPRKQGWHDKLASTLVLREKAPPVPLLDEPTQP